MKVHDVLKKLNYATSEIPVYVQEGAFGEPRRIYAMECAGYYYEEKEYTVASISLNKNEVIIHYKRK